MKERMIQWLSLVLAFVLVFSLIPPNALVAHATETEDTVTDSEQEAATIEEDASEEDLAEYRWVYDPTGRPYLKSEGSLDVAWTMSDDSPDIGADGVFTTYKGSIPSSQQVNLMHDQNWVVEWESAGNWSGVLLSSVGKTSNGLEFLMRNNKGLVALGYIEAKKFHLYGVTLPTDLDLAQTHVWRLENRVKADGTNMVYLVVDDLEIGAMNNYYVGSTSQNTTADWVSGHDFAFRYIGASAATSGETERRLSGMQLKWLQIWTNGPANHKHSYVQTATVPGSCSVQGKNVYTCYCGQTMNEMLGTDPDNHRFNDGWLAKDNEMRKYCADCGEYITGMVAYRWELNETRDGFVSVTTNGNTENALGGTTYEEFTIVDGEIGGIYAKFATQITLSHAENWAIQWACAGAWSNMFLSSASKVDVDNNCWYVYRSDGSIVSIGNGLNDTFNNYGVVLPVDDAATETVEGITIEELNNKVHIWRLENRVAEDGSNMVYLMFDGEEIGALDTYYQKSALVEKNSDALNGLDLTFQYLSCGTNSRKVENMKLEYLQIWTNGGLHQHDYETVTIPGTCLTHESTTYTCKNGEYCKHVYTEEGALNPQNHTGEKTTGVNAKPATCKEEGYTGDTVCECGATVQTGTTIEKLTTHSWGAWTVIEPATEEKTGTEQSTCSVCKKTEQREIPKLSHVHKAVKTGAVAATCGTAGNSEYWTCSGCGRYFKEEACQNELQEGAWILPATNAHTDKANDGDHSCDNCSAEYVSNHTGGTATCVAVALCADCGQPYGNKNPENHTGNNTTGVGAKAPSCGATGYTGDTFCECGALRGNGEETPATGDHTYGEGTVTQNTVSYTCTECGTVTVVSPAAYRWEMNSDGTALVSVTADGNKQNDLTAQGGQVSGGVLTGYWATMNLPITLFHNKAWAIEWECTGTWNSMLLSASEKSTDGDWYIFSNDNNIAAVGYYQKKTYMNYGADIDTVLPDFSWSETHTWRLENRVSSDGSNMIWLVVDGENVCAMDTHFEGSKQAGTNDNTLNGKDFTFSFVGTSNKPLDAKLNYLQIWANDTEHKHAYTLTGETDGNCVTPSTKSYICYCGYTYTEKGSVVADKHTGKNHTANVKPASCTEAGNTGDTVCECGTIIQPGTELPVVPHTWSAWKTVQAATADKAGYDERKCSVCKGTETRIVPPTVFEGKTVSILGDSISTFVGVSNNGKVNSTIGNNRLYYTSPGGVAGIYQADTWWQQVLDIMDMELLVNNSWSGSRILKERHNAEPAYIDRCVQLHNSFTGEEPDIILSFMATNDMSYGADNLGTTDVNEDEWGNYEDVDFDALIVKNSDGTYTYTEPQTVYEAYAIMIHKMTIRYPNAEIYIMGLLARRDPVILSKGNDVGQPTSRNANIKKLAEHFGCTFVELESCFSSDPEEFDKYIADQRVHPSKLGHDRMTEAVVGTMLGQPVQISKVTYNLTNATSSNGDNSALIGGSYQTTITMEPGYSINTVKVLMGGEDITESCYADGVVSIGRVTGDIVITAIARNPYTYRWEYNSGANALENITTGGYSANALTMTNGSINNGAFAEAGYKMAEKVILPHDKEWVIEWKSSGDWKGMFLSSTGDISVGAEYLYRNNNTNLLAFGVRDESNKSQNYGLILPVNQFDLDATHVWRLENRIAEDGSNMVYLLIDDVEIGALNNHYTASTDQNAKVDWINGHDFSFKYIGATGGTQLVSGMVLDYLQIWTDGTEHKHAYAVTDKVEGNCAVAGSVTYTCSCGNTKTVTSEIDPDNHAFGEWTIINGVQQRTCANCGKVVTAYSTSYRWEMNQAGNALVNKTGNGFVTNGLTDKAGSISGGQLSGYFAALENPIVLFHDQKWAIEWECTGTWNSMLLSAGEKSTDGEWYIFSNANNIAAVGYYGSKSTYKNYGADIDTVLPDFNWSETHVWRLENRVAGDGSNMIWLVVDGKSICAMNTYFEGSNLTGANDDTLNGLDFIFRYVGTSNKPLDTKLTYLQIWPDDEAHVHKYIVTSQQAGTCGQEGTVSYLCSCGKTYTESDGIPAAHAYSNWVATDGIMSRSCTLCGVSETKVMSGYLWQLNSDGTALVSSTAGGSTQNPLTVSEGTIMDGTVSMYAAAMDNTVLLTHDNAWSIEWKASGDWKGMLLLSDETATTEGNMYLYRNPDNDMLVMGIRENKKYHNHGIMMTDSGIDFTLDHIWRLENRIAKDGTNMVYLLVDGVEIGAMDQYYVGSDPQTITEPWLNGKDFAFNFIGAAGQQQLNNIKLEYLQIWTCAEPHLHKYKESAKVESTCAKVGTVTYTCSSCKESYTEDSTVVVPHDFGDWTEINGIQHHTCKECGLVENENTYAYRWALNTKKNDLISSTTDGSQSNNLIKTAGTIVNGIISGYTATMEKKITLAHDKQWVIEWSSAGNWKGMLLLSAKKDTNGAVYLYRNNSNSMIAFGVNEADVHHNYGIDMSDSDIDWSATHVWRLENRIAEDGSNMVYLIIDSVEIGAMNNYFKASVADETVDGSWLNGRDLTFGYIGAAGKELSDITLKYIQIWTENDMHKHAYTISEDGGMGTCIEKSYYLGTCYCGESAYIPSDEYGPHAYSEWVVVGEEKQRTCAICGVMDTVAVGAHYDVSVSKNYYKIISQKNYVLCDGVTESQIILNNEAGNRRQILNVVEADPSNPNVMILPAYYGIDKDLTNSDNWSAHIMDDIMSYYHDELGYNVVAGMNTALDYDSPAPVHFMVYNGKLLSEDYGNDNDAGDSYLAVYSNGDGTVRCEMHMMDEPLTGNELHVIPCQSGFFVKDGKLVKKSVSHSGMSVRSIIGIKKDGTLVIVQSDGENPPRAYGLNGYEIGETMKALGCEWAINGDGGGSSQIYTKREGESTHSLRNQPSDGSPRATSNGIIIASKATADGVFDHLSMLPESEYITPTSSVKIEVKGVDGAGAPAEMPSGITYKVTGGTYKKGVFKSDGTEGVQTVTAYYDGKEVGQVKINVVIPTEIYFDVAAMAVPYGKSVDLRLKASYGSYDVAFTSKDFTFELSQNIGTVKGLKFTAIAEDEAGEADAAYLTATLVKNKKLQATVPVLVGKGSEKIYDFEDKSLSGWYRTTSQDYNHVCPGGETFIVNKNSGKVHSGKYAMGMEIDYSNNLEGGFQLGTLRTSEKQVFTNATSIGMWIYLPDEADGLSLYMTIPVYKDAQGDKTVSTPVFGLANISGVGDTNIADTGFVYGMDESGWRYISMDVSNYEYVGLPILQAYINQKSGKNGYNYGYQTNVNGHFVMYVDDITVDYSQAVDDREVPIFSGMTYNAGGETGNVNGNVVSTGNVSFTASVAEDMTKTNYTGLDLSSGRVYVDGMDRTSSLTWSADGKQMILNNVYLSSGMHTIKFGVSDYAGNYNSIVRSIIVGSADSAKVKVVPHDPMADRLLLGSLYYIDVVADAPETISSVSVTLDLNNASVWELDHMEVANGFEATYSLTKDENIATITITSTGSTNLRGNGQILVSIPTRTWELEPIEPICEHTDIYMYDSYKAYNAILPMSLIVEIDAGNVVYKNGANSTFTGPKIDVDTEMCGNACTASGDAIHNYIGDEPWYATWNGGHDHRDYTKQYYKEGSTNHVDAIALPDKEPTCTESGYKNRTFCEVCNSVVTWGTTLPAAGHNYKMIDGALQCASCAERFNGVHTDGKYYVNGVVPKDGWIENSYVKDGVLLTGVKEAPSPEDADKKYYYDFGEDGVCKDMTPYTGVFKSGKAYYYAYYGELKTGWQFIDDEYYYFNEKTKAAASGKVKIDGVYFNFEEDGRLISGTWVTTDKGKRYYYGPGYYTELWAEIEGDWYYFKEGYAATGIYKLRRFNYFDEFAWTDLGEEGKFTFDYLDGFFLENNKYVHYAINGVDLVGLHQIGSDFYFFASNGRAATGKYYAWETHCVLPCGNYTFGPDGKMIDPPAVDPLPVDPTGKDGLSNEPDGIYYCVNGQFGPAGITKIGDYYYFVSSKGRVATGTYNCWKTNCEIPCGVYEFDEKGRMLNPPVIEPDDPSALDGLVELADGIYYYVNGKLGPAGLTKIGDYYYFVSSKGRVATGTYYCWATNCELPCGTYTFDSKGRMQTGGYELVKKSDGIYCYKDGKFAPAGITKIGDYYYFVSSIGRVATGTYNCWATNCELPCGIYTFDSEGRMLLGNYELVEKDGGIYCYLNGNFAPAGLTKIGDYYYFVSSKGRVATGTYNCWATNCDLPCGTYTFDSKGRMQLKGHELVEKDDGIYCYLNGQLAPAGITKIGDYYYFVSSIGRVATGTYNCWATNCELPCGTYTFDSKGRMQLKGHELVEKADGIYCYLNGQLAPAGITKVGDYYYFVSSIGRVATGTYNCWATNCEIPCGTYKFDDQGRMLNPPVGSTVRNGLVEEEDGIYYYVNGQLGAAGITKIGDYYYFVSSIGRVATGAYNCWKTNCEIPCGIYEFDNQGRMLNPPL